MKKFSIEVFVGKLGIYVVDMDGPVSVTNAAEDVVGFICFGRDGCSSLPIYYSDTNGIWDELHHVDGVFSHFVFGIPSACLDEIKTLVK
jgi:hypothetical protein